MTQTCRSPLLSLGRGTTSRTADETQKPPRRRTRKQSHLVHDERSRGVTASVNKVLQLLAFNDLASRIARVGGNDDLEALRADVPLNLVHIEAVLIFLFQTRANVNSVTAVSDSVSEKLTPLVLVPDA